MSKPQMSCWLVSLYLQLQYAQRPPAQNVSTRRNGLRPETRPTGPRPRHNCSETETRPDTHRSKIETRPRRDVSTSRDRLETETSRPRPHPCQVVQQAGNKPLPNGDNGMRETAFIFLRCVVFDAYICTVRRPTDNVRN